MMQAFGKADEILLNAVQGISDLINHTGYINSDFADVRTIMENKGLALMGIGFGQGDHRAVEAATSAISSPLLEDVSINGATGIIINITGGSNLTLHEVNEATSIIQDSAHEDAQIIFGTVIDESMNDKVKVTVIATGLGCDVEAQIVELKNASPVANRNAPANAVSVSANTINDSAAARANSENETAPATTNLQATATHQNSNDNANVNQTNGNNANNANPAGASAGTSNHNNNGESNELTRAREIAKRLGMINTENQDFDVPAFMRRANEANNDA
jgi:cell division GTPase FtsZ